MASSKRPRRLLVWTALPALSALCGALVIPACAASGGSTGSTGTSGSGAGLGFDAGTSTSSGLDNDAACATASEDAQLLPVNMYVMFDKSGSMAGPKWFNSTAALQAFFSDPKSGGLNVALRFFPDTGCDEGCGNVTACATPKVPLGMLTNLSAPTDTHEDALINAFVGVDPAGGTPMSVALDGAYQFAKNTIAQNPLQKTVVVLVTDGDAEDCEGANYLQSAAHSANANDGILTFTIGLQGSNEILLNNLASAGGTEDALIIGDDDAQGELVAALNEIRESTVACDYIVPESDSGDPVNPNLVNVLYTPGGTANETTIGQVPNAEACTGATGGWYYDNPQNPKRIIFCESTCAAVRSDENPKIDILLGCTTIPA